MTLVNAMANVALVVALLMGTIGFAALSRRHGWLEAESARKLVHVALGVTVAAFPLLFSARWPVWMLAGLALGALLAPRLVPILRNGPGQALHGVGRQSLGEMYFPLATALVWHLFPGDWMRFSIPMLVLATADATAALVRSKFGCSHYSTLDGTKTWLGSLTFYSTAAIATFFATIAWSDLPLAQAFMLAHLIGTLLMIVEALAWKGLDNLFIPVLGALQMESLLGRETQALGTDVVIATVLLLLCLLWRKRSTLDDSAVMGGALFGYITFVVGGLHWVLAPILVFLIYAVVPPLRRSTAARPHNIYALIAVTSGGLFWIAVH